MNEVPSVDDPKILLDKLGWIGNIKLNLPPVTRSWLNETGLYVQLHYASGQGRLEAGSEFRSCFDAWGKEGQATIEWEVRRFDRETWRERFAHLVWPAYELALFISGPILWDTSVSLPNGERAKLSELNDSESLEVQQHLIMLVKQAVSQSKVTREWTGLLKLSCESCGTHLNIWETQTKVCPYCKSALQNE